MQKSESHTNPFRPGAGTWPSPEDPVRVPLLIVLVPHPAGTTVLTFMVLLAWPSGYCFITCVSIPELYGLALPFHGILKILLLRLVHTSVCKIRQRCCLQ